MIFLRFSSRNNIHMKYLLTGLFIFSLSVLKAQPITTFILIRHAEKADDGTKDPDLNEKGLKRAESLVKLLKETKLEAIYSTSLKRTNNTVAPLSKARNISVQSYKAFKGEEIDMMIKRYKGGTILVVGHSNNIPWIANYLTSNETYKDFEDGDYDNLFIVTVVEKGKTARVIQLSY